MAVPGWENQRSDATDFQCFAPCPRGLEQVLGDELTRLGAHAIAVAGSGVGFRTDWAGIGRINQHTRLASRVLIELASGRYRTDKDLYKIAYNTGWERWLNSNQTLRVDTNAIRARIGNLNIATLRVKDAIVDRLREQYGDRPDIDTRNPDARVFVFLTDRTATLYLDTSGENLFKRGWRGRDDKGAAPLKENLAAGLLALAGWTPGIPLLDPFCGSGTIVIEAAQQTLGINAGSLRSFAYQDLPGGQTSVWARASDESESTISETGRRAGIFASDIDPAMVSLARANAARASADAAITSILPGDFLTLAPPVLPADGPRGMIISNPPYGERMDFAGAGNKVWGEQDGLLTLGRHLRAHYPGWKVCLLSADLKLPGKLGLKPSRRIELFNGPLETRLFIFEMRPA